MTPLKTDKAQQAAYYDHDVADPEFEVSRPHGQPRIYQYLMDFKFARVIGLLGRPLFGKTVLVICCGSGMDAEYLVRSGAVVVAMDISMGCLTRAQTRAERYDLKYGLVRGDAERLPFQDSAFDYTFVHDGLHHLQDPDGAIAEMARVARRGIIITEPADANFTKFLIRAHVMKPYEEAGNFVIRFNPNRLAALCRSLGFERVSSARYLMKYGHPPASWWRWLDVSALNFGVRGMFWAIGVALLGRWGNKLAFVAQRADLS